MNKTLHLNLKRQWFDMNQSGEKAEEYREISKYWMKRLYDGFTFKEFNTITFSNGYAKDRDQFIIELLDIEINTGRKEWGAAPDVNYFVLKLGKIIR